MIDGHNFVSRDGGTGTPQVTTSTSSLELLSDVSIQITFRACSKKVSKIVVYRHFLTGTVI